MTNWVLIQKRAGSVLKKSPLRAIFVAVRGLSSHCWMCCSDFPFPLARKLKCDGGRPACHQCLKRSNPCDYMVPQKRRGGMRQRRNLNNSDSEASGDERSVEIELEPSVSPETMTKPLSRVGSDRELPPLDVIQQQASFVKHEDISALKLQQFSQLKAEPALPPSLERRGTSFMVDSDRPGQLPPIALSPPSGINSSAPPLLPSIRGPDEPALPALPPAVHQPPEVVVTQRKRVPPVPGKGNRSSSNYGPKVVACNHCRGNVKQTRKLDCGLIQFLFLLFFMQRERQSAMAVIPHAQVARDDR